MLKRVLKQESCIFEQDQNLHPKVHAKIIDKQLGFKILNHVQWHPFPKYLELLQLWEQHLIRLVCHQFLFFHKQLQNLNRFFCEFRLNPKITIFNKPDLTGKRKVCVWCEKSFKVDKNTIQ